jgi:energy-coupling factor transport system permease protein
MNLLMPGMYVAAETIVHRVDPRIKMGAALLFMALPFAAPGWQSGLVLVSAVGAIAALAAVPLLELLRTLRTVFWLGFFMFFFYAFTTPGPSALSWGTIRVTWSGLVAGGIQIYRLCLLVTISSLLTYTTSPTQLAHGLEALFAPLHKVGLPVRALTMVLTIALRFVPTMAQQVDKLSKAQRARGMDYGSAPWNRARSWVPMFVPLFVAAFRRADRLATAMEARGFRGTAVRTRMFQLHLTRLDLVAAISVLLVAGAALATNYI